MTSENTSNPDLSGDGWTLSIDFGTTSTVAALTFADGRTDVLEVDGERRTPSVVLVDDDGSLVVGAAAVGLAASRPERTIRAPKRRLGEQTPVVLGGKPFNPVDLVASILRHVIAEARRHVGSEPSSIRLTHPATWSRPLQQRLLEAAAKAGMANADLVAEPVAAAMASADRSLPVGSYVAVYDLGGGTFDTTVVQSTEAGYIVVGHPIGDRQIGGELFDEALMNHVGSRLDPQIWEKIQVSDEREWHQAATRLLGECRRVKEALSTHGYGEIVVGTPSGMIDERVTRDELEAIVAPYLEASVDLLERCVDDVGIEPSQLSAIHMIGGASRMPLAAKMVEEAFPGVEVSRRGDPRTAVALGAALVDLSALQADVVADHNTTVEKRQRSIDAEAAAIDAAKAARNITPPANPSILAAAATPLATPSLDDAASPVNAASPLDPMTVAEPPAATAAATAAPTYVAPAEAVPQQPVQQQAAPYQPLGFGAATPPPGTGGTASTTSSFDKTPILAGIGVLALALIAGLAFMFTRDNGDVVVAGGNKATVTTVSIDTTGGGDLITLTTLLPEPTTTAPSSTTTTASTTTSAPAPVGGPSRDDAVGLLFDVEDLGAGWTNGTFEYGTLDPCGIVDPHQPVFVEGRQFNFNLAQADAAILSHFVLVYANETEAAAVMTANEQLGATCPSDEVDIGGVTYTGIFQSCDLFATCPDTLPPEVANFLPGDQFILQFAYLTEPTGISEITDQIYGMRIGRSIVVLEYVVPGQPTETQFDEASTLAVTAWGNASTYPR